MYFFKKVLRKIQTVWKKINFVRGIKHRKVVKQAREKIQQEHVSKDLMVNTQKGFFNKVVIWGHKPFTHTHSFIHSSYYRAFRALGYDTYWLDAQDDLSGMNFENTLFLTEDQAKDGIPLNRSSYYILHHCKLEKFLENGCKLINLCNYTKDLAEGNNFYYPGAPVEKLTYYAYFDPKNMALFQPWGTDLLPSEISGEISPFHPEAKVVYYVGSVSEDEDLARDFTRACRDHGKKLVMKNDVPDEVARKLVRESYISPDIRCRHHIKVGYIPCRLFKNISYGVAPATNSYHCKEFFQDMIPYSESAYGLFEANEAYVKELRNQDRIRALIDEVKNHHTYVTRIETIVNLVKQF